MYCPYWLQLENINNKIVIECTDSQVELKVIMMKMTILTTHKELKVSRTNLCCGTYQHIGSTLHTFTELLVVLDCKRQEIFTNIHFLVNKCNDKTSDDSSNFEKPFEIVDLSEGHSNEHQSLEERPQHNTGVCVVVN